MLSLKKGVYAYLFEIVLIFIIFDYVMRGYRCVGEYVCVYERPEVVDPTGARVPGSWEPNSSPMQNHSPLLTTEPSSHPTFCLLSITFYCVVVRFSYMPV